MTPLPERLARLNDCDLDCRPTVPAMHAAHLIVHLIPDTVKVGPVVGGGIQFIAGETEIEVYPDGSVCIFDLISVDDRQRLHRFLDGRFGAELSEAWARDAKGGLPARAADRWFPRHGWMGGRGGW